MGALITEDHLQKVLGFMDIAKKEVGIFSCIAIHGCICTFGKLFLVGFKVIALGMRRCSPQSVSYEFHFCNYKRSGEKIGEVTL